jgi:hypothetical protein
MVTAIHLVAVAHPTAHRRRQDSVKQQHVRRSDTRESERERERRDCGNGTFEGNMGIARRKWKKKVRIRNERGGD